MKSITIHNLDPDLAKRLEVLSQEKGVSQNKLIKALLRKVLNLDHEAIYRRTAYYAKIFGTMKPGEAEEFFANTKDLSDIFQGEW